MGPCTIYITLTVLISLVAAGVVMHYSDRVRDLTLQLAALDKLRRDLSNTLRHERATTRICEDLRAEIDTFIDGLEQAVMQHMSAAPNCGCSVCTFIKTRPVEPFSAYTKGKDI